MLAWWWWWSLMRYNPHTYAEGTAWLSLSQLQLQTHIVKDAPCLTNAILPSGRSARRKGSTGKEEASSIPFHGTRREPEPILLRQDTKEGSDRERVATKRRRKEGRDRRSKPRSVLCRSIQAHLSRTIPSIAFHSIWSFAWPSLKWGQGL